MDIVILYYILGVLAFIIPIGVLYFVLKSMRKKQETPEERAERKKNKGFQQPLRDVRETRLEEDDKVSKSKN